MLPPLACPFPCTRVARHPERVDRSDLPASQCLHPPHTYVSSTFRGGSGSMLEKHQESRGRDHVWLLLPSDSIRGRPRTADYRAGTPTFVRHAVYFAMAWDV